MKKFISLVLLVAILLSCCGCKQETQQTAGTTEPIVRDEKNMTPEELYGHIDQTVPQDGVYKIWSAVGVQNIAAHPDASFEFLCHVDMQGAVLEPIGTEAAPFTGTIQGSQYTLSNFTVSAKDGLLGFVGVNKGTVRDLRLENVTMTADESVRYVGAVAAINEATILRCSATGTVDATKVASDAVCGGAVGKNTGEYTNAEIDVDLTVQGAEKTVVGGIAGTTKGGKIAYVDNWGQLIVTGNGVQAGLLAGIVEETVITDCAFMGETNTINDKLFINLIASGDETLVTNCVWRDNTPVIMSENEEKLRDTVVQRMLEITTIEWKVKEDLVHNEGSFAVGWTYYGMPYKHMGASLARIQYLLDEDGYIKDFAYELDSNELQNYMGNDCSTALIHALWTVSNSVDFGHCSRQYPWDETGGCLYVGDWEPDPSLSVTDSSLHIAYNGEQKIYEAYAQLKKGDFYVYNIPDVGGHTRMAAENAVVAYNQDGTINPNYSYVTSHEQGWTTTDETNKTHTTCRANHQYTFANLLFDGAVPVTCEELVTGEMEPATCEMIGGLDGRLGLTTGTVKTNYYLDYVDLVICDESGEEVFNHRMFPTLGRTGDSSDSMRRFYIDEFDMGRFATPLAEAYFENGQTYSYKIYATNAPGDTFLVKEGSFTQGG